MIEIIIIASIVVAIVVAGFTLKEKYEKYRARTLSKIADQLGLRFSPEVDAEYLPYGDLPVFSIGHSKATRNRMWGWRGSIEFSIYGYQYAEGSGKHLSVTQQTIAQFTSEDLNLPCFHLCPEDLFDKLDQLMGNRDIDFALHPAFSKQYRLHGRDEKRIRNLFDDEKLEYFQNNPGICAEGNGNSLIYFRTGERIRPDEYPLFIKQAEEVYQIFKREQSITTAESKTIARTASNQVPDE